MQTKKKVSRAKELFAVRIEKGEAKALKRMARREKTTTSAILRSAWTRMLTEFTEVQ